MLYACAHYFNALCYFMEHFMVKLHFFSVRLPDSGSHLGDASVPTSHPIPPCNGGAPGSHLGDASVPTSHPIPPPPLRRGWA
jgi:hypothetical protein